MDAMLSSSFFEGRLKKKKKLRVIIEFKEGAAEAGIQSTKQLMKKAEKQI